MDEKQTGKQEEQQLVVFDLAQEAYGVDINVVREIIRMQDITSVPKTLDFVRGVINLRGRVIPVVDLRKRFALPEAEHTKDSRIVVVDISGQDIGMVVDAVTEVMRIPNSSVAPPSAIITSTDSDYLQGIVKLESKLIILLDLDRVFTEDEKQLLEEEATPAESPAESLAVA